MEPRYSNFMYDNSYYRNYMMPAIYPNNNVFTSKQDGFLKGNMEKDTYIPYKNMTYIKPTINNEREDMLYKISEVCFAAHDVNLYLDTHPNDVNAINLYNKYNNMSNELISNYEKKFGPINLSDNNGLDKTPWAWINKPWPWNN